MIEAYLHCLKSSCDCRVILQNAIEAERQLSPTPLDASEDEEFTSTEGTSSPTELIAPNNSVSSENKSVTSPSQFITPLVTLPRIQPRLTDKATPTKPPKQSRTRKSLSSDESKRLEGSGSQEERVTSRLET
jgi:hypothetical protein